MRHYLILLFVLICSISATYAQQASKGKVITNVEPKTFQQTMQAQQGELLDVRTSQEYAKGHLANSRNLDIFNDNFKENLEKLDKNKSYYVYCHSGGRSTEAAEMMEQMGFTKIYNMQGGITAWQEAGLPVTKSKK